MRIPAPADSVSRCHIALMAPNYSTTYSPFYYCLNHCSNFLSRHLEHLVKIFKSRRSKKQIHPSRPSPWTSDEMCCDSSFPQTPAAAAEPHTRLRRLPTRTSLLFQSGRHCKYALKWGGFNRKLPFLRPCPPPCRHSHSAHAILLCCLLLTL